MDRTVNQPPAASEVPTFFGPADSPLFGVVHLPADRRIRGGVIICSSLGKQAMDSAVVERILACDLADRGFGVLRFDYLCTGDSAYPQTRADAVEYWRRSIGYAIDYLTDAGAGRITAIGMRAGGILLGNYLQTPQPVEQAPVDQVVYLDPVGSGRRYLREQQALFRMSVGEDAIPDGEPDDPVSIIGARLNAVAVGEFSALTLTCQRPDSIEHLLVLRTVASDRGVTALAATEGVQSTSVEGLIEFDQPAEVSSPLPFAAIEAVVDWVDRTTSATDRRPVKAPYRDTARMPVNGTTEPGVVVERIETIDESGLFTIRTMPENATPGDGEVVLFYGTANDPHVGPAREWVELSRRIAQRGAQAVRWDRTGVGQSGGVRREHWQPMYSRTYVAEAVTVARHAARDTARLRSVGICSGSWYAAHAVREIGGGSVVLVNPLIWNWRTSASYMWQWNARKVIMAGASAGPPAARGLETVRRTTIEWIKPARAELKRAAHTHAPRFLRLLLGWLGLAQVPETVISRLAGLGVRTTVLLCPQDAELFTMQGGDSAIRRLAGKATPPELITPAMGDHAGYSEPMLAAIRQTVLKSITDPVDGKVQPQVKPDHLGANRELRQSFIWRTLAAAVGMVSTFALTIIVVRTLDSHEAATFFAILAALSIGPLIGRLGLGPNVIRLIPAEPDPEGRRRIAGIHLRATFLMSCLSAPFIALVGCNGLLGHRNFWPDFVMTTLLIAIESTRLMVSDIFAATGRVRSSVATMHYIRSVLVLPIVAAVTYFLSHPTLVEVLAAYLAVATLQFTAALVHARRDIALFGSTGGITTLRKAIGEGTQLFTLEFSGFMMMQGTIWFATAIFSPLAATQYAAAATLAMQVTILESLSTLAATPPAARLWAAGRKEDLLRTLSNASTLNTLIAIVVVGLIAAFGSFAIELAYGPAMRPAGTLLLILAASGIIQAIFNVNVTVLIVGGYIRAAARTAGAVLVVALPAAIAAALLGGPLALAIVSSVSVGVMSICQWLTARRILARAPHAHLHPIRAARELMNDQSTTVGPELDALSTAAS
ncbi:MAG: hypothetical protein WCP30_10335 [Mycobacteriaceae bacterium]